MHWKAELRDSSNYIRQVFSFTADDSVRIKRISLVTLPLNYGHNYFYNFDKLIEKDNLYLCGEPIMVYKYTYSYC